MGRAMIVAAAVLAALAGGCSEGSGPASSGAIPAGPSSGLDSLFSPPAWAPAFSLLPVDGVVPLRMSTSIGVLEWTTYAFPEGWELRNVVATEHGPVATSSESPRLMWSQDSVAWHEVGTDVGGRLAPSGGDVVLFDGWAVRYAWNGSGWAPVAELDVPGWVRGLAFGARGAVATYVLKGGIGFAHSSDGLTFAAVEGPAPEDLTGDRCGNTDSGWGPPKGPQVLATRDGFVAMTPSHAMDWGRRSLCEPVTWTSSDGIHWTLRTPESPFGRGVVVDAVAERAGRFVAVGRSDESGAWSAWTSGDAVAWEPVGADLSDILALTVSSGPLGWIITGATLSADGVEDLVWTSTDGVAWEGPHTLPTGFGTGYLVVEFAIGTDSIFGIGGREPMAVVARVVAQ